MTARSRTRKYVIARRSHIRYTYPHIRYVPHCTQQVIRDRTLKARPTGSQSYRPEGLKDPSHRAVPKVYIPPTSSPAISHTGRHAQLGLHNQLIRSRTDPSPSALEASQALDRSSPTRIQPLQLYTARLRARTMVLKLRLSRPKAPGGSKKHHPRYNIVLAHARTARDSRPLEVLGTYNPIPELPAETPSGGSDITQARPSGSRKVKDIKVDVSRTKYWLGVGAQPSETVWRLLSMVRLEILSFPFSAFSTFSSIVEHIRAC